MPVEQDNIIRKYIPNGFVLGSNATPLMLFEFISDRLDILNPNIVSNPNDRAEVLRYLLSLLESHKGEINHYREHEAVLEVLPEFAKQQCLSEKERAYVIQLQGELDKLNAELQSQQQQPGSSAGAPRSISITDVQDTPHSIHAAQDLGQMLEQAADQPVSKRI